MAEAQAAPQTASLWVQIPKLMAYGLSLGLALAAGWAALSGVMEMKAGEAYLSALNQAWLVLLWALIIRLAACAQSGENLSAGWPLASWALGLTAVLLIFGGLSARSVINNDWRALLALGAPMMLATAASIICLWAMARFGGMRERVVPTVVFALCALGLALLSRVGVELIAEGRREVLALLAWRQSAWFGVGLVAMALAAGWSSPRRLARLARKKYLLPVAACVLLLITWAVGPEINGRRLWLTLGQLSLQTVEAVKFLLVLFVAAYFTYEHPQALNNRPLISSRGRLGVVGPFALMIGLPLLALGVQKDFGPAVLIYTFFLAMLYLAAGSRTLVFTGIIAMLAAGTVGYWLQLPRMLHYRVQAWLDPFEASEHLTRGLWSIAHGGIWGSGWGVGRPHTVPLAYSDFAFTSLAEELGFMGAMAIVALLALFAWRSIALAMRASDPMDRLLASGITVMITLQALLVLGGVTGLIPLAGLTLPFISHGGSSLVVNMAMAGLLMRIAKSGAES